MTNSQLKRVIREEMTNVLGRKKSKVGNNKRRLNESGGSYQMYNVIPKELEMIGKAYERYETESVYNYGVPTEDEDYDGDGWDEWSTREAKVEILEEVLKVLNEYSDYADEDIIIK